MYTRNETDWQDCCDWTSINEAVRRRRVADLPAIGNESIVASEVQHVTTPRRWQDHQYGTADRYGIPSGSRGLSEMDENINFGAYLMRI